MYDPLSNKNAMRNKTFTNNYLLNGSIEYHFLAYLSC